MSRAWTDRRQSRYFAQFSIRSHPRLVRSVARTRKIMAMVNRSHAFAEGLTLPAPERLGHLPRNHKTFVKAEEPGLDSEKRPLFLMRRCSEWMHGPSI